ncbi:hypothetical protein [Flavobacterium sp. UBA4854]|uniref:HORMA-1 domain-containing protein n=1 Tax=Flavobacterium sp. UBA4854 TaxID=1946548 RepID=UPI00257E62AB|nr:hypothetical protein [Flavobacterium sp. UBA4854]
MSSSYTSTQAFTITHAKHLASKVAADLKRMQRFYGAPSDLKIADLETELIEFLRNGYLDNITYGYKRDGKWIEPTLKYTAKDLNGMSYADDDPGKVRPNANVSGASFSSYLVHNSKYDNMTDSERNSFEKTLPINRTGAPYPGISGYMDSDKSYSSGGKGLDRSSLKSY